MELVWHDEKLPLFLQIRGYGFHQQAIIPVKPIQHLIRFGSPRLKVSSSLVAAWSSALGMPPGCTNGQSRDCVVLTRVRVRGGLASTCSSSGMIASSTPCGPSSVSSNRAASLWQSGGYHLGTPVLHRLRPPQQHASPEPW